LFPNVNVINPGDNYSSEDYKTEEESDASSSSESSYTSNCSAHHLKKTPPKFRNKKGKHSVKEKYRRDIGRSTTKA